MSQEDTDDIKAGAKEQLTAIKRARVETLKPAAAENRVKGHAGAVNAAVRQGSTILALRTCHSLCAFRNEADDCLDLSRRRIHQFELRMQQARLRRANHLFFGHSDETFGLSSLQGRRCERRGTLSAIRKDFHQNLRHVFRPELAGGIPRNS